MLLNNFRLQRISLRYRLYGVLSENGPVYAYYTNEDKTYKHLVVTGVDCTTNTVYTNNSWGVSGEQSFEEFLGGVAWTIPNGHGMTFKDLYLAE